MLGNSYSTQWESQEIKRDHSHVRKKSLHPVGATGDQGQPQSTVTLEKEKRLHQKQEVRMVKYSNIKSFNRKIQ